MHMFLSIDYMYTNRGKGICRGHVGWLLYVQVYKAHVISRSDKRIQVGEPGQPKSFLIEISWGESYPDDLPKISLDAFYNNHL